MDLNSLRDGIITNWISELFAVAVGTVIAIAKTKKWTLGPLAWGMMGSGGAAALVASLAVISRRLGNSAVWVEFSVIFIVGFALFVISMKRSGRS